MQRGKNRYTSPMIQGLLVCLMALCLPVSGQATSPYQAVQQGNALYQSGKYPEAAEQYGSASQVLPDAAEIHFNQGNAAYKQQDYGKAHEHYTQALQTADRTLEGKVKYNLGNVEYQQALQNLQQPQVAMPHLRSAMTYYRDSLDVEPQQQEARYNLELSHLVLHKLTSRKINNNRLSKIANSRASSNRASSKMDRHSRRPPRTHNRVNNRPPRRITRHLPDSRRQRNRNCVQKRRHVCSMRSGSGVVRRTISGSSDGPRRTPRKWTKTGKGSAACLCSATQ